ncbi:MAG: cold shock domain-containing protein [Verrucomicrobia bacterium]|nr:cold shock domain-containing protein [Verrucomicrobiota bacterium]
MVTGNVKWFDSKLGYGFIHDDKHGEIFVHHSAITGEGFKTLRRNEVVQFDIVEDPRGLQAANVVRSVGSNGDPVNKAGKNGTGES